MRPIPISQKSPSTASILLTHPIVNRNIFDSIIEKDFIEFVKPEAIAIELPEEEVIENYKLDFNNGAYAYSNLSQDIISELNDSKELSIEIWFNSRTDGKRIRSPKSYLFSMGSFPTSSRYDVDIEEGMSLGNDIVVDFSYLVSDRNVEFVNLSLLQRLREDYTIVDEPAYKWYFADQEVLNSNEKIITHSYAFGGFYQVTLVVYYSIQYPNGDIERRYNFVQKNIQIIATERTRVFNGISLFIDKEYGQLKTEYCFNELANVSNVEFGEPIESHQWDYVCLAYSNRNNTPKHDLNMYTYNFNEKELRASTFIMTSSEAFLFNGNNVYVADNLWSQFGSFEGSIFQIRVWKKELVQKEILSLISKSIVGDDNVIMDIRLNESIGYIAKDSSGYGNNLRLVNRHGNTNTKYEQNLYPPEWNQENLPF